MAELETAKSAGFCFGVEKAVNTVYSEIGKSRKIYTYGPIIHNENVVEDLRKQGVGIAMNEDDIVRIAEECRKDCTPATVIIRLSFRRPHPSDCRGGERQRQSDCNYRKCRPCGSRGDNGLVLQRCFCDRDKRRGAELYG